MAKRKTVEVATLLQYVNLKLKSGGNSNHDIGFRNGIIAMLERVLHDTGNYNGFRYLTQTELDLQWKLPDGFRYLTPKEMGAEDDVSPDNGYGSRLMDGDDTRREYF